MLKSPLIIALLALCISVFAQSPKIQFGEEFKESKASTLDDIVGYDNSGFYIIRYEGKKWSQSKFYLEHFNNQLNKTKSYCINENYDSKRYSYNFSLGWKENLLSFYSYRDKSKNKNLLYVQEHSKSSLEPKSKARELAAIDISSKSSLSSRYGRNNSGDFFYSMSQDSNSLLVYYDLPLDNRKNERYGFHVYNEDFTESWRKQVELPYEEELFVIKSHKVDNNGNVYILGKLYKDRPKERKKGEPNYTYELIAYRNKGEEVKKYPINMEGFFLNEMQIAINDNLELICAGFYSDAGSASMKGSFFLKINLEDASIITKNTKEFNMDFITQNMRDKQKAKTEKKEDKGKDVELYNYDLDDIILKSDGGAILIGEQYYWYVITTRTSNGNGGTTTTRTYHYHYNDMIAINHDAEGNILWAEKVAKRQHTQDDNGFYSSYVPVIDNKNEKIHFIFNDNPKNIDFTEGEKIKNFKPGKESWIAQVSLDYDNGNQKKNALFSSKDVEVIMRAKVCEQTRENEVILFGERRKNMQFIRVTY